MVGKLEVRLCAEQLSLLLRFHGDHELSSFDSSFNENCEDLVYGGFLEKTFDDGDIKRFRITHEGFVKTSVALSAVNHG